MDTAVRPPESPPADLRVTGRRRWPRHPAVVTSILLTALVAAGLYLSRYQPLSTRAGGASGAFSAHLLSEGLGHARIAMIRGDRVAYWFTLTNTGRLPVTVTGVGDDGCADCVDPLEYRATRILGLRAFGGSGADSRPFSPFTLGRGEATTILVQTVVGHCDSWANDSSATYVSVRVGYSVLGIDRHAWVDLPMSIEIWRGTTCTSAPA